jgi:hypothetical protein
MSEIVFREGRFFKGKSEIKMRIIEAISKERLSIDEVFYKLRDEFPGEWTRHQVYSAMNEMKTTNKLGRDGRGKGSLYWVNKEGEEYLE